jgi:uncharacterized SAM-binding protein YcdF (DUF218 family)
MLYLLRKTVPVLLMPFDIALALLVVGVALRRRKMALAGLALMVLASLPLVSNSLCLYLENQYPRLSFEQCPPADAIVALSGFAGENTRFPGEIRWYYTVDRFEQAVKLFKMQKAPIILFTDTQAPDKDHHEITAALVRQAAIDRGVPAEAIRLTDPVTTTGDEATAVKKYLARVGGQRIILVTSAVHMGRAAMLFRRAGIDFIPFPVDYQGDTWEWQLLRFMPSPTAMDQTEKCLHEIYGDLFYRVSH